MQLQVVLGHVLLGEGDAGVEYQDVKSVKESVLDLVDVRTLFSKEVPILFEEKKYLL